MNSTNAATATATATATTSYPVHLGTQRADGKHAGQRLAPLLRKLAGDLALGGYPHHLIEAEARAVAACNPPGSPKWMERTQANDLRNNYVAQRTSMGVLMLSNELDVTPGDGKLLSLVAKEHKRLAERWPQRYAAIVDRAGYLYIDLRDFTDEIACAASFLGRARGGDAYRYNTQGQDIPADLCGDNPRDQIERMAVAVVEHFVPAVQNIVARLPVSERDAAAVELVTVIEERLAELDILHTLARTVGAERKRWEWGFGAVDAAVWVCAAMVGHAYSLAQRLGPVAGTCAEEDPAAAGAAAMLRSQAQMAQDRSLEAVRKMNEERQHALFRRVWRRQNADMIAHARATGGISPRLEVMHHAKGSRMMVG